MGWKHYQTVDHLKWEPQVGGLFGIHLLILHFKFQFSKSIKSWIFHEIKYSLSQNVQKSPKNLHETQNRGYGYKHRDLALLKTWPRYWPLSDVKTVFTCTPALILKFRHLFSRAVILLGLNFWNSEGVLGLINIFVLRPFQLKRE